MMKIKKKRHFNKMVKKKKNTMKTSVQLIRIQKIQITNSLKLILYLKPLEWAK